MKIDTAVRAVFETEKRRPVRSSIATFLKQCSDGCRPPASWRCSKMDADAYLAFASGLGLREGRDYTVVRSSLDPHAIQLKWSAGTANRLTQALSEQPSGWLNAVYACAYSLETLPEGTLIDTAAAEEPEESVPAEAAPGPSLAELVADRTLHIARAIKNAEFPDGDEWISAFPSVVEEAARFDEARRLREWGDWYPGTASDHPCHVPPFAPMPMVEAYVRVCLKESRPGWPETPVFSCRYRCTGLLQGQDVRELYRQVHRDETVPQGNMFLAPLESQFCETCSAAPLTGYFTRNLEDWRRQNPQDKVGAWIQFNTLIRPTVAAARFMLQPKDAAGYVRDLYRIAYGQDVMMSGFTRTAVHNLFPDVPGADSITCDRDDDDCDVSLAERIDSDTLNSYGLYYMGGLLVTAPGVTVRSGTFHETCWKQRADLPALDPGDPLDKFALRTDELGKEWFAIIHGTADFVQSTAGASAANLNAFRDVFSKLEANPPCVNTLCSVESGSHFFTPLGEHRMPQSAFMSSLCGILRRYGPQPRLEVVDGYRTVIHRIWSGMTTSMSRSSGDQNAFPWVPSLPVVDQLLADWSSPRYAENANRVTDALNRLRTHPECQFRFTERERGSTERRNCVVMVETNVSASKFLGAVLQSGKVADLSENLKIAFTAPYVFRACCPGVIAASPMDSIVRSVGSHVDYSRISAMASAVRTADCRDILHKDYMTVDRDGGIQLPHLDTFPVDVRVTWDKEDRLVILFSLDGEAAQVLRLTYRCGHKLPLATASYLKSRGKAPEGMFMMDESLPQEANYVRYLKAQMKFNQFHSFVVSPTELVGGAFAPVYDSYALRDFDWDDFPSRNWYDPRTSICMAAVLNAPC